DFQNSTDYFLASAVYDNKLYVAGISYTLLESGLLAAYLLDCKKTYYQDNDGDGFGTKTATVEECSMPAGYVSQYGDCDDNNPAINPAASEICGNGIDENCDGQIDDGCSNKALMKINSVTVKEAPGAIAKLIVTLSKKVDKMVAVYYSTVDGTARSKSNKNNPADFTPKSGTLHFPPCTQQSEPIIIDIINDGVTEPSESFTVQLSN